VRSEIRTPCSNQHKRRMAATMMITGSEDKETAQNSNTVSSNERYKVLLVANLWELRQWSRIIEERQEKTTEGGDVPV